jgi:4-diphosphocytidyl-2-C-methyl-D-erythritol kinase
MICFPNAKLNIGLHVTEKRSDGYHNIESIFYPIPFNDVLEIIPKQTFSFKSYGLNIPGNLESNLVYKAFKLMKEQFNIPEVEIQLIKAIPMGAGLGGGSSNAAFTISSLNELFELNLSQARLEELASEIGSDCPFFIENKPKFVYGRGEKMEQVELELKGKWILLANPNIHISTKEAYNLIQPKHSSINLKEEIKKPITHWRETIKNDFQNKEYDSYPEIKKLHTQIEKRALYTSLTGSGSSVYGIFNTPIEIETGHFQKWLKL